MKIQLSNIRKNSTELGIDLMLWHIILVSYLYDNFALFDQTS